MAKTFADLTIWTALACDSGTRATGACPVTACTESQSFEGQLASTALSFSFPTDWAGAAEVLPGRVVRITYADADWDEWRVEEIVTASPKGVTTVTAKGIVYDLAVTDALISENTATGAGTIPKDTDHVVTKRDTVANVVTWALGFAPAYFASGTLTPSSTTVEASVSWATPLAALLAAVQATKLATGVTYYLAVRRNGTTSYYVDITDLNASAVTPDIRTGKNLLALKKTWGREVATRVYPQLADNAPIGVGTHMWLITAVSTNTYIDIQDPHGRGICPLAEDDAFNNLYWWGYWDNGLGGVLRLITDSTAVGSTARLYMSDTSNLTVGAYGRVVSSTNTTVTNAKWVTYVDRPSLESTYGGRRIVKLTVPESTVDNLLLNPDLEAWTAGSPDYWTANTAGGYIAATENTDAAYVRSGSKSAKLTYDGSSNAMLRQYPAVATWGNTGALPSVKYRAYYYLATNNTGLRVEAIDPGTAAGTVTNLTTGKSTGTWYLWESSVYTGFTGTTGYRVGLSFYTLSSTLNATAYIDSVEALIYPASASVPDYQVMVNNSTGAWLRGVTYLQNPPITYEATLQDLSRLDDGTWPYDALVLGGPVTITDLDLNQTVTARVVRLERNHLNPLATKVTISNQRDTLTRLLVTGG